MCSALMYPVLPLPRAGNRRGTLHSFLRGALEASLSRLRVPEVALGSIQLYGAVGAHIHGEALPRRFQDVAVVRRELLRA